MTHKTITSEAIQQLAIKILDDHKGVNIQTLDVRKQTSIADFMIICSATSNRHAKSLADNLIVKVKAEGIQPLGIEGERECEWILIDLIDVIVHIMLPATRDFYNLEKLWGHGE